MATIDKFAMLPWRGETGMLFGRALAQEGRRFLGPLDKRVPKSAEKLPEGLRPPELVVQDELHLISGPLGTMAGLYETAIETLCRERDVRPKVLASTATVRRASAHVQALFGRRELSIFPPPGIDDSETFFARVDHDSPGRLYVRGGGDGTLDEGDPAPHLVDEAKSLVTSANFTDRGQTRNIEMGVLIEDPSLAKRLVQQWRGLIESGLVVQA